MVGLAGGCGETPSYELDPMLEENDDGKYDGPKVPVELAARYHLQIDSVEVSAANPDFGDSLAGSRLYVSVQNARTAVCPTALLCSYYESPLSGTLSYDDGERAFSGRELLSGVDISVHEVDGTSLVSEVRETVAGLTHIPIGRTGSLIIKPFGRVKKITFRLSF
jgi:hypothetical protein